LLGIDVRAAVPRRRLIDDLPRRQNEFQTRAEVLTVGAVDGSDGERMRDAADLKPTPSCRRLATPSLMAICAALLMVHHFPSVTLSPSGGASAQLSSASCSIRRG
jgi:hypothetical protein